MYYFKIFSLKITLIQGGKSIRDFTCPGPSGSYPNPDDCSSFYVCSNGIPNLLVSHDSFPLFIYLIIQHQWIHHLLQNCPEGLVYNPATELCDYPFNVPSCNVPQTSSTTSTPLPITTTENNCIDFPDSIECQTTLIFSTEEPTSEATPPESTSSTDDEPTDESTPTSEGN